LTPPEVPHGTLLTLSV